MAAKYQLITELYRRTGVAVAKKLFGCALRLLHGVA